MSPSLPARRIVLVLGMHRSGTSALSRAVHLLGARAPATLMPPGPDNPRGFWESSVVAAVNDEILAAGGSGWADWRRFEPGRIDPAVLTQLEERIESALAAEFGDALLPVLKDPRLSRLLPVWRPVLDRLALQPCALLALRHPAAVANSLARRNGCSPAFAVLLWLRHVLDAERDTRGMPRAFVSFGALQRNWRAALQQAGERLGLAWPRDPHGIATDFLDARPPDPEAGPETGSAYAEVWSRHAWQALRALERGEAADGLLDRVRGQFEDACRLFASAAILSPARPAATWTPGQPAPGSAPECTMPAATPRPASSVRSKPRPPISTTLPTLQPPRAGRVALRQVTLCAADTSRVGLTARALSWCVAQCDFADAMLFSDQVADGPFRMHGIARLASRADYSAFMLRDLVRHVETSHALVVQWDGFVTGPATWDPGFLDYDYVGARWGWHAAGSDVGNGGFSLRSRRLLEALAHPQFRTQPGSLHDGLPEDELICRVWRPTLERDHAIRFAPALVADRFAYERLLPRAPTFGFHGLFNMWRHLDDASLAELVPLLPADVTLGREFAELAALCFLHQRPVSLLALAAAWRNVSTPEQIRAALGAVLRPDELEAFLRATGIG